MEARFRFIDLFSGIGGFHLALASVGGRCVMACDTDTCANESYRLNFGMEPRSDIREIASESIPQFDLLCAGFPCQSFSRIGGNGGLTDSRGALVHEVFRILEDREPSAFILENVEGLANHDSGKTLSYVIERLEEANYRTRHRILEAKDFDLPQIRKRLFIVGINRRHDAGFKFPDPLPATTTLSAVLGGRTDREYAFTVRVGGRHSGIHNRFNWDCYVVDGQPRYLTAAECLRLQGFPAGFRLEGNTAQQFRQAGNSVPVTVVRELGRQLVETRVFDTAAGCAP